MPLLATLVVEYAIDAAQLVAGATAAAESMAAVDDAAIASSAAIDAVGVSAASSAVGMGDFNSVVDLGAMSFEEFNAYTAEANIALGIWTDQTNVATVSVGDLNTNVAGTAIAADASAVSLDAVAASTNGVTASLVKTSLAADKAAVSMAAVAKAEDDVALASDPAKKGLGGVGLVLAGLAIATGIAAIASVKMAGDFQKGLTALVTGAGELQSNLGMVGDGIKQIAIDTGTSTKDLLSAMFMVNSAGNIGAKGLQVLRIAAEGAKTDNADLTTTTMALTGVMTNFKIPASGAAGAMNELIAAAKEGKMHLQDLSGALGPIGEVAVNAGLKFADVGAAIAMMTNANVSAQQASQNLAFAIRSLDAPSGVAVKSLTAVGLSAQQVADTLRNQGLPAALQLIEDHVGKKFPQSSVEWTTAMKNIMGGKAGLNIALALGGDHLTEYEKDVQNITKALNAGGDSVEGWSMVQDTFNNQIDRAKAVIEVLGINIGTVLLPIMGKLLDAFTSPAFLSFAGGVGQAILATFRAIGDLISTRVVPVLQSFWQFIQTQIIPVLVTWGTNIKTWVLDKLTALETFLETKVVPALEGFWSFIQSKVIPVLQSWGNNIKTWVIDKFNDLKTFLETKLIPGIQDFWQWVNTKIVPVLQTWGNAIKTYVIDKLNDLKTFIDTQVIPKLSNLWGWIQIHVISAFSNWRQEIQTAQNKLNDLKSFIDTQVMPVLHTIWSWIQANVVPVFQSLGKVITKDVLPPFHDIWDSISNNLWPALQRLWQTVGPDLTGSFGVLAYLLTGQVADSLHTTKHNVDETGNTIKSVLEDVAHFIDGISMLINWLITAYNWFKALTDAISGAATAIIMFPSTIGKDIGSVLPHFASGVDNFSGGLALVGENGPELVNLPGGSSVMNASKTNSLMYGSNNSRSPLQGGGGKQEIHIHNYIDGKEITNNTMNRVIKELRGHGLKA